MAEGRAAGGSAAQRRPGPASNARSFSWPVPRPTCAQRGAHLHHSGPVVAHKRADLAILRHPGGRRAQRVSTGGRAHCNDRHLLRTAAPPCRQRQPPTPATTAAWLASTRLRGRRPGLGPWRGHACRPGPSCQAIAAASARGGQQPTAAQSRTRDVQRDTSPAQAARRLQLGLAPCLRAAKQPVLLPTTSGRPGVSPPGARR